jgi:hypothetical protein
MSSKRKEDESFEEYRERLRREKKALSEYLRGKPVWFSSKFLGKLKNRVFKQPLAGTYIKDPE